jgi:hypothetical protein
MSLILSKEIGCDEGRFRYLPQCPTHATTTTSTFCFHFACPNALHIQTKLNSVALVRERTIPTERPPLVCEVSANFCGYIIHTTVSKKKR